jgi:pimeloyl-ACP methyl ester carboxylesterase
VIIGPLGLPGTLTLPPACSGLVAFAHGSGSSRLSPRNTHVATQLNGQGFATLLFDLLSEREAEDRRNVFDIPLLGNRVLEALRWTDQQPDLAALRIGIFGASTGAAAALVAAAAAPDLVKAVVSRGGRPDLAGDALRDVEAPTLLIVGGRDHDVLDLNRAAQAQMRCPTSLIVVPGATHLFEEPGTLDQVVAAASRWFSKHLAEPGAGQD